MQGKGSVSAIQKPKVVCFQETKMEKISAGIVWDLWGGSFTKWTVRPASGASGGILLMWDKCVVECIEEVMDTFSICCKFKSIMDRFVWAFSGVYGPNVDSKRHSSVGGVGQGFQLEAPCYIGGDFSVTPFLNERVRAAWFISAMWEFSNFILEQGMMDIPLPGGSSHLV